MVQNGPGLWTEPGTSSPTQIGLVQASGRTVWTIGSLAYPCLALLARSPLCLRLLYLACACAVLSHSILSYPTQFYVIQFCSVLLSYLSSAAVILWFVDCLWLCSLWLVFSAFCLLARLLFLLTYLLTPISAFLPSFIYPPPWLLDKIPYLA